MNNHVLIEENIKKKSSNSKDSCNPYQENNYLNKKNKIINNINYNINCPNDSSLKKKRDRTQSYQYLYDKNFKLNQNNSIVTIEQDLKKSNNCKYMTSIAVNDVSKKNNIKKKNSYNILQNKCSKSNYTDINKKCNEIINNHSNNSKLIISKNKINNSSLAIGNISTVPSYPLDIELNEDLFVDCSSQEEMYYFFELEEKRKKYLNLSYFQLKQNLITIDMRAVLIDWLMLLSAQLGFKRDTFHLSVSLIDIALSQLETIESSKLQLVGVTCLIIAAKYEEICSPNMDMYAYSTGGAYTSKEIIFFEQKLLNLLSWNVKFPNIGIWTNYIVFRWDQWIYDNMKQNPEIFKFMPSFRINFKNNKICNKPDDFNISKNNLKLSNINIPFETAIFNRLFRCIDLAVLDFEHISYDYTKFVCALIYLIVGNYTNTFDEDYIQNYIACLSDLTELDSFYNLNSVIDGFLSDFFNIGLSDIAEYINIGALYYSLTANVKEKFNVTRSVSNFINK